MAYRLKTKRTRKHATLNSLTETAILSLVAKLGQKCNPLLMKKPEIYKNIRKIKYSTTEQKTYTVGGTSTSFGQFSYLCPKKPEGARRSSDLYCPIRKNYELAQKNERECFQV